MAALKPGVLTGRVVGDVDDYRPCFLAQRGLDRSQVEFDLAHF